MLQFFTGPNESLLEQLQADVPEAHLVKAFNSVGSVSMVNPTFPEGKPTMFICGADASAKKTVPACSTSLAGRPPTWAPSRPRVPSSPSACFWCIPGFTQNQWTTPSNSSPVERISALLAPIENYFRVLGETGCFQASDGLAPQASVSVPGPRGLGGPPQ